MDRTAVILRVFAERARTRMARLEVELAQFAYELPRIRDDAQIGDREGGGGRGGRGNSNVELAKQASREHIAALRREIAELRVVSQTQRARRATARTVALVGYTNAGKSSWLRALTGSDVLVENKLFATLGTTVRQLAPAPPPAILIADTVGFIRRLPHALVESFRSTLDEVNDASILLIVVDASDPTFRDQLAVTREVMEALGAADRPWRILLNKVDRLDEEARAALRDEYPDAWMFSAHQPADVAEVRSRIVGWFQEAMTLERIEVPYGLQHVLQEMRTAAQIVSEEYLENIVIHVRASPDLLMRWKKQLAS